MKQFLTWNGVLCEGSLVSIHRLPLVCASKQAMGDDCSRATLGKLDQECAYIITLKNLAIAHKNYHAISLPGWHHSQKGLPPHQQRHQTRASQL